MSPLSRRELHSGQPAHLAQVHFFSHGLALGPHQLLHSPDVRVVVVVVARVVGDSHSGHPAHLFQVHFSTHGLVSGPHQL